MNDLQYTVKHDSILFEHVCPWGVTYDPAVGKFVFQCRTDSITLTEVKEKIAALGLCFNHDSFNNFVAVAHGTAKEQKLYWEVALPEHCLLSGEILLLNSSDANELRLLKISHGKYLVVKSGDSSIVLRTVSCSVKTEFYVGANVSFDQLGDYTVKRVDIIPPSRVARALDYKNGHVYKRSQVAEDISQLIPQTLRPLIEGCFETKYLDLAKEFACHGVSSWALQVIADAYATKYMV